LHFCSSEEVELRDHRAFSFRGAWGGRTLAIAFSLLLASFAGCSSPPHPDPEVVVEVVIRPVATLGTSDGDGMIVRHPVLVSSLGPEGFAVTEGGDAGAVKLYALGGEFVRRLGGRPGQGPGEFLAPTAVRWSDSARAIDVIDVALRRWTRLDPESGDLLDLRLLDLPGPTFASRFLPDGRIVANGVRAGSGSSGRALHVIDPHSGFQFSLGPESPVSESFEMREFIRPFTTTAGGEIWVASRADYSIEAWDGEGRKLRSLQGPSSSHPPRNPALPIYPEGPEGQPPPVIVRGSWQDDAGFVIVVLSVPAHDWWTAFDTVEDGQGPPGVRLPALGMGLWTTRIEVLDAEDGSLVGVATFPQELNAVVVPGLAAQAAYDENLVPVVHLYEIATGSTDP
jgi:hypothetical protein